MQAAQQWHDVELDMIFINGDHSAESCLADIKAWFPKLSSQGRTLGHDAIPGSSVECALKQFRADTGIDFRIHAMPLRFTNPSPPSSWIRDFHPQVEKHAWQTTQQAQPAEDRHRLGLLDVN